MASEDRWPQIPAVCLDEDICRIFHVSLTTLKRRRRHGTFPVPPLPSLDRRHRYSRQDVIAVLERRRPNNG